MFASASELPHTVLDLPSPAEGHILEAVELLLALPAGPLGRRDLLQLAMHPRSRAASPTSIRRRSSRCARSWASCAAPTARDLAGSYLDQDRVSWDQGLRRLALGAFLSGRRSGEERPFSFDGEADAGRRAARRRRAGRPRAGHHRARADRLRAHGARAARRRSREFMALLRRTLAATIRPASPDEQAALGDCFARAGTDRGGGARPICEIGFGVAAELVRARLAAAPQARRARPKGVTVATFAPLRALPFRIVFMLGLDERVFPSAEGFGALDLRAAAPAPQPGDVTPREQDEYVFLETLLSARERLYLSYVARDAATGERKDPSSTLLALRDVLGAGAGGESCSRHHAARPAAGAPPRRRRLRGDARRPRASARRRRSGSRCGRPRGVDPAARAGRAARGAARRDLGRDRRRRSAHSRLGARSRTRPAARVTTLTLADLRRFLECPLQGSVRVLLPMRDDDDADDEAEAALRERENLGDARVQTLPLLRDLFGRALDAGRHRRRRAGGALRRRDRGPAARRHAALRPVRRGRCAPITSRCCARGARGCARRWRASCRPGSRRSGTAPRPSTGATSRSRPAIPLSVPLPDGPRDGGAARPDRAAGAASAASGWR